VSKVPKVREDFRSRWQQIDVALQQSAAVGGWLPGEAAVLESVGLCSLDDAAPPAEPHGEECGGGDSVPLRRPYHEPFSSSGEREAALFSWRYPLVFEAMAAAEGREDMTMAAMRILDEADIGVEDESRRVAVKHKEWEMDREARRVEAIRFLQFEVAKGTS
jgi:hypothetical protein